PLQQQQPAPARAWKVGRLRGDTRVPRWPRARQRGAPSPSRGMAARARRGSTPSARRDDEASVFQAPERVRLVVEPAVAVKVATAFAPFERRGCRRTVHDLHDRGFVHAVLGPRAGEVLDAADLDGGYAGAVHLAHTMPVGVAGRVADDAPMPLHDVGEALA